MAIPERDVFTDRPKTRPTPVRDYPIRLEDEVICQKCRRRFEIPSHQSLVFL